MRRELIGTAPATAPRPEVRTGDVPRPAMRHELVCTEPATPPRLEVRTRDMPRPRAGQVLVRVQATSVNPIDVKRAAGYGRRLLGLKGAASFPLVLGNDVAGTVEAAGAGVSRFAPGQRVFGLLGTGKHGGAHASYVVVPQAQLAAAPEEADLQSLAILPYSFTTMWLAVRATGLAAANAAGVRVLINGASGGLGRLALQMLHAWGSRVTRDLRAGQARGLSRTRRPACGRTRSRKHRVAACGLRRRPELRLLGRRAGAGVAPGPRCPGLCDHGASAARQLRPAGLGARGAACWRDWKRVQSAIACRALKARYRWTIFKPDREALEALAAGLRERRFSLPVGISAPLEDADAAFAHVAAGKPGRAVLLPCDATHRTWRSR